MPTTTPLLALRKPLATEPPDGAGQMGNLADDIDGNVGTRLPRTLLIATRNSGGTVTRGSFVDMAFDTVVRDPLSVLQSGGIDIKLPYTGVYEIETKFTVTLDLPAGGRLVTKWWRPASSSDGPWGGVTAQAQGIPLMYRDTFVGPQNDVIRVAHFVDGTGSAGFPTTAWALPKVVLRYLGT